MEIYTTKEFAEKLEVSEIWVRELARKGCIYPARKVGKNWVFFGNSTVIRPPEQWNRKPKKMKLPHEELTTRQLVRHMRDAIHWGSGDHPNCGVVANVHLGPTRTSE